MAAEWKQRDTSGTVVGHSNDTVHVAGDWDAQKNEALQGCEVAKSMEGQLEWAQTGEGQRKGETETKRDERSSCYV